MKPRYVAAASSAKQVAMRLYRVVDLIETVLPDCVCSSLVQFLVEELNAIRAIADLSETTQSYAIRRFAEALRRIEAAKARQQAGEVEFYSEELMQLVSLNR